MSQVATDRRALVDKLAADLQARMLSGELPSGTRLRQAALAEEFGVSRTPVREALRKLQASGFVELRPNKGALVRGLSPREIRHAYEVRAELEGLAADLAAQRIRHDQLDRLHDAQAQFREALARAIEARERRASPVSRARDRLLWARANDQFHQVIQEAAGNDVLVATLANLHRSFPRDLTRIVLAESTTLLRENIREHEAILEAIERRDPPLARELMQRHVRRAGNLVTLRVEERSTGDHQ
ncbi:MAG TPA: GntR family transcriptional regulator [Gaiellaceae bacterium]|nr:GntR family transcriptional regulator [Gaiellaceae bacterium]